MLQSCLRPLRHGDLFLFVPILSCLFKLFVGHNAISILLKFTLLFQKNLIKPCSVYPFKLLRQVFAFRLESMSYGLIIYQFSRFDIIFSFGNHSLMWNGFQFPSILPLSVGESK